MNKTLITLIVAILALGVAIYFFQGKVITTTPEDTTPTPQVQTQEPPPKVLPPSMEDGTIVPDASDTPSTN